MTNSTEQIKQLRTATGVGVMAAKQALEQAKGDYEQALKVLGRSSQQAASKRTGRATMAGVVDSYLHQGRVGSLVELNCETDFVARTAEFKQFAHELAMQVASMGPLYLNSAAIPTEEVKDLTKQLEAQARQEGAQPAQVDKVVTGRLRKYYQEVCLLDQASIIDSSQTIEQRLHELIAKLGENIMIKRFARFEVGE